MHCVPVDGGNGESHVVQAPSIEQVKAMIKKLEKSFDELKNTVRECVEKRGVLVKKVADVLTSLSADEDDQHKMFVEDHTSALFRAANVSEQFGTMNFHWNYLNPPLLDHLVQKLELKEVKVQMDTYKSDLQQFRVKTPLTQFCQTQRRRRRRPTAEFRVMVAKFEWPESVTLEVVEEFREEYASQYNLQECAMMIAEVRPGNAFLVSPVHACSETEILNVA